MYGFINAYQHYGINIRYMENEEGDERQQRSDQHVDDMNPVSCENVHFLLRVMNRVKEPEGPNFMANKMVKPEKEFSQQ